MSNYAIIIGIDNYSNPEWNLTSAVSDTLRFTRWALENGDVRPENLRLLLSPINDNVTDLTHKEANWRNIIEVIQEFQEGLGKGGDRLYFYFAGHGLSAPEAIAGAPLEPAIIPTDVESLRRDSRLLIGFSDIFPPLINVEPVEQFFFIDACRDFQLEDFKPPIGRTIGPWIPPPIDLGLPSTQYIIYSTSPGQKAFEEIRGLGVFSTAIMNGLQGKGSSIIWSQENLQYEVRFSNLVTYIKSEIRKNIEHLRPRDWERYIQIPQRHIRGGVGDPVLVKFPQEEISSLPVRVRVRPSNARQTCKVQALQYFLPRQQDIVVYSIGPPAPLPCAFQLLPGYYSILVRARGYTQEREACSIFEPKEVDIQLVAGLESLHETIDKSIQKGNLEVNTSDPNIVIAIWDAEGRLIGHYPGGVYRLSLSSGIYRVVSVLPGEPDREHTIEVLPGQNTYLSPDSPPPRMGHHQLQLLNNLGISTDPQGYMRPSELLEGVANARLSSILSFAAFAAIWPEKAYFHRLRSLGIEPIQNIPEGSSVIMVLIGVGGDQPAPDGSISEFLNMGQLTLRDLQGQVIVQSGFEILPNFDVAGQQRVQVQPGPLVLELRLLGFTPTNFALTALADRVTVLIAVIEDSGEITVQQYLLPLRLDQLPPDTDFLQKSSNIQRLEIAQRYYANGQEIPEYDDLNMLLWGKWMDPLMGCIAGYSLIRTGKQDRFVGYLDHITEPNELEPSAMRNMLKFFDGLPDSHILAGLCEPEKREEHFAHAVQRGLPMFSEGFRVLHEWYLEQIRQGMDLPTPRIFEAITGSILHTSPWTAWVTSRPAISIQDGRLASPPLGWEISDENRESLEQLCRSVGLIKIKGPSGSLGWATGFQVAEDVIMTADFVATQFSRIGKDMQWVIKSGFSAQIDFREEHDIGDALEFDIIDVIGIDQELHLALLKVACKSRQGDSLPEPPTIASQMPEPMEKRKVCVVGYPFVGYPFDARMFPGIEEEDFERIIYVKRLLLGELIMVSDDEPFFYHDCPNLPDASGASGSCVFDLDSNKVIGLHFAGRFRGGFYYYNTAVSLWKLIDSPLLKKANIIFG